MEEYHRQQRELSTKSSVLADEVQHKQRMQQIAQEQEQAALELIKSSMSREKVQEMKHQSELRSQMQMAFKTGDKKTYERLKERLAADDK
jgi:NADH:ubiquinone oxidoreductase subunit F (NADH-binding)